MGLVSQLKYLVAILAVALLVISSCAAPQQQQQQEEAQEVPEVEEEQPVDTEEQQEEAQNPVEEEAQQPEQTEEKKISEEVQQLLDKQSRVKSLSYKYDGPALDDLTDFFLKDGHIAYNPTRSEAYDREDFYDTIYLNTEEETAASYCADRQCRFPGKKEDLNYEDAYVQTPFDWTESISEAEKITEQQLQDRNTWKVETDKGTMWIDSFYGVPLKIEIGSTEIEFKAMEFNSVSDGQAMPSE